jgi:predicted alpha/beta-hydrolase family hydrolase
MTHASTTWTLPVGTEATTAIWEPATTEPSSVVFVCAHGAGGHMADSSVLAITHALRARGVSTVRFNFLYRAQGQKRPDPMPRLLTCWNAVVDHVRRELAPKRLILGGRSMGGRAASVLVSGGTSCKGLLLLAYPLHPPGQPHKLRIEHLPAITVPVLCMNGTRDPFCTPDLMERTLEGLGANWRMHWLEHADHSFHVLKRSGRTNAEVLAEAADAIVGWTSNL